MSHTLSLGLRTIPLLCAGLLSCLLSLPGPAQILDPAPRPRPIPLSQARSAEKMAFEDETSESGIAGFRHVAGSPAKPFLPDMTGSGVALFDYDNDGWLDIYLVNALSREAQKGTAPPPRAALFRNNRDGTFSDVTAKAGVENRRWGTGVCVGDINNDGSEDMLVTNLGKSRLYKNNGDGTFVDIAPQAGVDVNTWATGCAFGDYNRDGLLDLFVAGYVAWDWDKLPPSGPMDLREAREAVGSTGSGGGGLGAAFDPGRSYCEYEGVHVACGPRGLNPAPDFLFRNENGRSFRDVTKEAGVADQEGRYGFAVAWVDLDEDGWLDLVVANDSAPNYVFHSKGDGTFEEVGLLSGLATDGNGRAQAYMGMAVGDYNRDGRVDFFMTTFSSDHYTLYRNNGPLDFTDTTSISGVGPVTTPLLGWGTEFFDYDNDGWLDLFAANGHTYPQIDRMNWNTSYLQRTLLLRNLRNGRFEDVTERAGEGFTRPKSSRGAAVGDLFNDGSLGIVLNNLDGPPSLLRNRLGSRAGHWLSVRLLGNPAQKTPRDAIGSVAFLTQGGLRQRGEVASGRSYLSQSDLRIHFGLGTAEKVDRIEIRWSNGRSETFEDLGIDRMVTIEQGKGVVVP